MMCKKILLFTGCLLACMNVLAAAVDVDVKEKVVIIYDRQNLYGYNDNIASSIGQLLGAFNINVEEEDVKDYIKGTVNKYSKVFVLGLEDDFNNVTFINDLKNYGNKICWIGSGIEAYIVGINTLYYEGYINSPVYLYYTSDRQKSLEIKNMKGYILEAKQTYPIIKSLDNEAKIYGYLSDGNMYYPYILNYKNLWYVSRIDVGSMLFNIFSDVLNDIFDVKTFKSGEIFVRIEDVHPFRDTKKLKDIADYLYSEGVPFIVALIPAYVNPDTGYTTTLSERPDFVNTIKYMQDHGGSVILHGYTHQFSKGVVSGEGYEFWDGKDDEPLKVDMSQYVYEKASKGIELCVENEIYPLGFEAPHYAMDARGYREIKKYFSTYIGQFQNSNVKFATNSFPYELHSTELFNRFIPENLGYVNPDDLLSVDSIEYNFVNLSMVRGYRGGFFFHPYVDIKYLKEIINFLKENNVQFLNLKYESNWVQLGKIKIASNKGEISVTGFALQKEEVKYKSGYISSINQVLTIIVGLFAIVFLIIFISLKYKGKNKFLR